MYLYMMIMTKDCWATLCDRKSYAEKYDFSNKMVHKLLPEEH